MIERATNGRSRWNGFINATDKKFFQINEVICVPVRRLWEPMSWWAVFHEIGHVLIDRNTFPFLNITHPAAQAFLVDKPSADMWGTLLGEFAAEVVGFELCFFNNYELFVNKLWSYLKEIIKTTKQFPMPTYLTRTFYVELWHKVNRIIESEKVPFLEAYQKVTEDPVKLFEMFLAHVNKIEAIIGIPIRNKHFLVAGNLKLFQNLNYISEELYKGICALQRKSNDRFILHRSKHMSTLNVDEVINCFNNGQMYDGRIEYPEEIIYKLLLEGTGLGNKATLAMILTFWNSFLELKYKQ